MAWKLCVASAFVGALGNEVRLKIDQIEQSEDGMSLLQTQARMTKPLSLLETEEQEEYAFDSSLDMDADSDSESDIATYDESEWAGGYKRCFGSPRGAHSQCKVVGGGKGFAASARLCAQEARKIEADTFQFLANGAKCWLKRCNSINMKYSTEGRTRPWQIFSTFCGLTRIHTEVESDCIGPQFTNYLVFPKPTADACSKDLKFRGMKSNNMNGFGPAIGAQVFRFAQVLPGVDLVVKADEGYRPANAAKNGVYNRKYGRLNMMTGTSTFMTFRFVESNGQKPVKVPKFLFTVFDVDHGKRCSARMTVNATKYASYHVAEDTELIVKTDIGGPGYPASSTFSSSTAGTGKDNPRNPFKLTDQQARRAVTFQYENVKFWTMGFEIGAGSGGRNIMFGGHSSLTADVCPQEPKVAALQAPLP